MNSPLAMTTVSTRCLLSLHAFYIFLFCMENFRNFSYLFVCVFQYTIFTRRENQAQRTLNGCYRADVYATA